MVESLLEYLKENQKTVNSLIRLSSGNAQESRSIKEYTSTEVPENKISILLDKLLELIELNKLTLETIDLLDKRVKRLHSVISQGMPEIGSAEPTGTQ